MNTENIHTTGFITLATWSSNSQGSPLLNSFLREVIGTFFSSCRNLRMPIPKLTLVGSVKFLESPAITPPQQNQRFSVLKKYPRLGSAFVRDYTRQSIDLNPALVLASPEMGAPKM